MDKATVELIKALMCGESCNEHPFKVGEKLLICTVTRYLTGRVSAITGKFLTLEDAAWIADTGRFMGAINNGVLSEIEPVNYSVRVNMESIVDVYEWRHDLPRVQK